MTSENFVSALFELALYWVDIPTAEEYVGFLRTLWWHICPDHDWHNKDWWNLRNERIQTFEEEVPGAMAASVEDIGALIQVRAAGIVSSHCCSPKSVHSASASLSSHPLLSLLLPRLSTNCQPFTLTPRL